MKFTFKTDKPTGRYSSFFPTTHYIKLKKEDVGSIVDNHGKFKIKLKIVGIIDNPNCPWHWVGLKKEFDSLDEAKEYLNSNFDDIFKLGIYIESEYNKTNGLIGDNNCELENIKAWDGPYCSAFLGEKHLAYEWAKILGKENHKFIEDFNNKKLTDWFKIVY